MEARDFPSAASGGSTLPPCPSCGHFERVPPIARPERYYLVFSIFRYSNCAFIWTTGDEDKFHLIASLPPAG
jgi:hypothetical protein